MVAATKLMLLGNDKTKKVEIESILKTISAENCLFSMVIVCSNAIKDLSLITVI